MNKSALEQVLSKGNAFRGLFSWKQVLSKGCALYDWHSKLLVFVRDI
jgi:hypothetical protein